MTYQPDIIIYHYPCRDGFAAAWACWKRFGDAPEYFPTNYGKPPPDVTGKHVLIVDFSYKRDVLIEVAKSAKSVIVLDHHLTAKDDLAEWQIDDVAGEFWAGDDPLKSVRHNDDHTGHPIAAQFDMEQSGAGLAWSFCHDAPLPQLIALVQDRDLWRFRFAETRPFNLMLQTVADDFQTWDDINAAMTPERMMEAHGMLRYQDFLVHQIAARAQWRELDGINHLSVSCPPELSSEVGHHILDTRPETPFASLTSGSGWSLRSTDDRMDVSEIAKRHGGGGHRNAAGFVEEFA